MLKSLPFLRTLAAVAFVALACVGVGLDRLSASEIRHSFFVAGPTFTGIIDEAGKEVWDSGRAGARDGMVLANGNVLIAWNNEVKELTRERKTVFHYAKAPTCRELGTAQRLPNGNTLITELGVKPRLLEITASGTIAVDVPLLDRIASAERHK